MTILQKISDEDVFQIKLSDDKKSINIIECADYWKKIDLSKSELLQLIDELKVISEQMKELNE